MVNDIVYSFEYLLNEKGIDCRLKLSNVGLKMVPKDFDRLVRNLVSNAIKYNKENGKVTVSLSESETEVAISVEDSGIGIAKKDIPRLCERFYRVSSAHSKTSLDSNGLGLSIVKQIVDDCNAQLAIESEVGKGSKFTITFKR